MNFIESFGRTKGRVLKYRQCLWTIVQPLSLALIPKRRLIGGDTFSNIVYPSIAPLCAYKEQNMCPTLFNIMEDIKPYSLNRGNKADAPPAF